MTEPAGPNQDRFVADEGTLFLLGNGPSLAGIDLRALSAYPTLGMNAAYRYWREIGWRPRYYACLDKVVGLSHKEAIAALITETGKGAVEQFLLRENLIHELGPAAATARVVNFDALRLREPILRPDPVTTGSHAALWAATAGFRKIVMLGIDGKYVEYVEGARATGGTELEIVEDRENPNYFFAGYQQKGDRYNIPNPRPGLHLEAWEIAAALLRAEKVAVVNGNPKSAVRYFPFVDAASLVEMGEAEADARDCKEPRFSARELLRQKPRNLPGRLQSLITHQRTPLLAVAAMTLASACGAFWLEGASVHAAGLLLVIALFLLLAIAMLTIRDVVSEHIGRLDSRITMLESALADFERRYSPAHSEPSGQGETQLPDRRGLS